MTLKLHNFAGMFTSFETKLFQLFYTFLRRFHLCSRLLNTQRCYCVAIVVIAEFLSSCFLYPKSQLFNDSPLQIESILRGCSGSALYLYIIAVVYSPQVIYHRLGRQKFISPHMDMGCLKAANSIRFSLQSKLRKTKPPTLSKQMYIASAACF